MKVFISYGHDQFVELVRRFKTDLEKENFEVWIDERDIEVSNDWQEAIEKGIESSNWMILMMTEHSMRRPHGVCLDEVAFARALNKDIIPIMLQTVRPPLCLSRLHYLDVQQCFSREFQIDEEKYRVYFEKVLKQLRGQEKLEIEGNFIELNRTLMPLDNEIYIEEYRRDFYGRKWLFEAYAKWLEDFSTKVFVMLGQAGSGKTAFVAELCHRHDEIYGAHFCKYNNSERANPKRAIMSIAYHLSTQVPAYRDLILQLPDLDDLISKGTNRLFEYLITEPLRKIPSFDHPVVLIIDALDEASKDLRTDLLDVIVSEFNKTPEWLKLFVTTRPEKDILRKLRSINSVIIEENDQLNMEDIKGYLREQLNDRLPAQDVSIIETIARKSEGNFLYAKEVVRAIKEERLDIEESDRFPDGLTNIYSNYFTRMFTSDGPWNYRQDIRPLMEILSANYEPLSVEVIDGIIGWDSYDAEDIRDYIHVLFPTRNGVIEPIHKSIMDWLTDREKSGSFRIHDVSGHGRIVDYLEQWYDRGNADDYLVKYHAKHAIKCGRLEITKRNLTDESIQRNRIKILGLDTAIRELIEELKEIGRVSRDIVHDILGSPFFQRVHAKNRSYFYNSGLYFPLKANGFEEVMEAKMKDADDETSVSYVYYLYITEAFTRAIHRVDEILNRRKNALTPKQLTELYVIKGLCFRKHVNFGALREACSYAIELNDPQAQYELSLAHLTLGKAAYHELRFQESGHDLQTAIDVLSKELSRTESEDRKITIDLFLAEYYRVYADRCLWDKDMVKAKECLDQAHDIYAKYQVKDRYYVRYVYTNLHFSILEGHHDDVIRTCREYLEHTDGFYDKGKFEFWMALAFLLSKEYDQAIEHASRAIGHMIAIESYLEAEEFNAIRRIVDEAKYPRLDSSENNETITNWAKHAYDYIRGLME
jgi:tetratricopeptide (TPR) repeat protein